MNKIPYKPYLKQRARSLRKNSTLTEILLWKKLKSQKVLVIGFHARSDYKHLRLESTTENPIVIIAQTGNYAGPLKEIKLVVITSPA